MTTGSLSTAHLTGLSTALAGRYALERQLGAGGMATVWLARDLRHEREVAIKVLHPDLGIALGAERFLGEIKTTARLQHPHVLPLLDSGDAGDGLLFYVMPYVRGETLRARLERERQLPIDEAVRIAREVAGALHHAHGLGIVHRDVKPENILLQEGHALVADFGIALAVQHAGGQRLTATGVSLGTPQYMSPEQAMGERAIDARTDVYALGAVAYEMLAGVPPFTGATTQAIVAQAITATPDAPSRYRDTVPHAVDAVVLRALAKAPADRWPDAGAFATALDRAIAGDGWATRGVSADGRVAARRRWATVGAAAAGGALVAAGAMAMLGGDARGGARGADGVTLRTVVALPDSEAIAPALPLPAMALAPTGDRLYWLHALPGGKTQIRVRRWDRLGSEALPRAIGDACCLAVSPSGDSVAYRGGASGFELQALAGGAPRSLSDSLLHAVNTIGGGVAWGADGMLYVGAQPGLVRVDPRTDAREVVATLDEARGDRLLLWPSLLPDGKSALVTVVPRRVFDRTASRIGIADFATRKVELVEAGLRAIWSETGHLLVVRSNGVLVAVPFDLAARRATARAIELPDTLYTRAAAFGTGAVDLALSPDGTLAYLAGNEGRFELGLVDRAGAFAPVADQFRPVTFSGLSLSPDGRRVVLSAIDQEYRGGMWIVPLDGRPPHRIAGPGDGTMRPRWRPGTDSLTYSAIAESTSLRSELRMLSEAGGATPLFPLAEPRGVSNHAWSADGRWLLIRTENQAAGNGDILALRPGIDSVPRPIVATPAEEFSPALSPDGRWLAYSSDQSGRREVYVRPFPEGGAGVQVSGSGGMTPVWGRDGREIFFVDGERRMAVAAVTTGATFRAAVPRVLFPLDGYRLTPWQAMFEVAPDGRLLIGRQVRRAELRLVVVTRFHDEIARRGRASR